MRIPSLSLLSVLLSISFLSSAHAGANGGQKEARQDARRSATQADPPSHFTVNRVLLISIDGFHATDLADCIEAAACPALAQLSGTGVTYTNASTTNPSDSFPGMVAQVTGALPPTTGIWYDDHYRRDLSPAGSHCATVGTEVNAAEPLDFDPNALDGGASKNNGQGLDVNKLPLDPKNGCKPVYPHSLLRVNTIFEVIRAAGLRTAWSDKHPAYDILNGPSGTGVEDAYNPEINSLVPTGTCNGNGSNDWTSSICAVTTYDGYKVRAIIHEIDGFDHTGTTQVGVPAIFGMNFQTVSVGQKLHTDYQKGECGYSYVNGVITPTACLASAIKFVDTSIGQMISELSKNGLLSSTLIVISAKHGQSPIDPSKRVALDAGLVPTIVGASYAFDISDDASLIWLTDQTETPSVIQNLSSPANQAALGIQEIFSGNLMKETFDDPLVDPRTPDIILKVNTGVIFTGGRKIAEHGGMNEDDLHVALLVSNPNFAPRTLGTPVQTKQIAPTILRALGIPSIALQGARIEKTLFLPGLFLELDPKLAVRYLLNP
jgi:type I phosphodiesterase/nucleotide pyrophosphatase